MLISPLRHNKMIFLLPPSERHQPTIDKTNNIIVFLCLKAEEGSAMFANGGFRAVYEI